MRIEVDDPTGGPVPPVGQHERLFHGFLEAAPDAVVIIDGDGVIAQVNSQTERLFGFRREEMVGRPLEMLMPERYRGSHVAETRTYVADPRPRTMGRGLELFGLRKDGDEFPIDVSISPLPPERGVLVASTIRDMTSQRRLENELRQRTHALEAADRLKDDLLSAVAHELRSPLSVLHLVAPILRSPQTDISGREQTLRMLERQTAHMARMIEDLLDLARVRSGTLTLRREVVDLRAVVANAVDMAKPLIESRRHRLEIEEFTGSWMVSGDPVRLVQVFSNLFNNAAKFTPEGGHIRLAAARAGGAGTIRIRDNGAGISKEMLPRVFELFTQVDPANGRAAGLGIGLALTRQLVEKHGGTVEVTSDGSGKGSEFRVSLPLLANAFVTALDAAESAGATSA